MIIFKVAADVREYIQRQKDKHNKVGFVPTMGALHAGHISLVKHSIESGDITVSSIFVNPTQFNDPKDYEKYPSTISNDVYLLEQAGCNVLFLPSVKEIYPTGLLSLEHYDLGDLENVLEGKYRPGHFQGVCQVVHRLLDILKPHNLFLGQKDYQQSLIIKRLIAILNLQVEVITSATLREQSGLAMSSRNVRLNDHEKEKVTAIFKMLNYIHQHFQTNETWQLEKYASDYLYNNGFSKVDYVSIADANSLQPTTDKANSKNVLALIAAYMGEVRLIDNMTIG